MKDNSYLWNDVKPRYVDGARWSGYGIINKFEITLGDYNPRGWMPGIPDKIIQDFSNHGDMILDQFVGGGTTLMEAVLLQRHAIGCDINDAGTHLSRELVRLTLEAEGIYVRKRDARRLSGIGDESIDLICTQPPYLDVVKFSTGIKGDMSLMSQDEYMASMSRVAFESYRVLKKGRYCVIMIGDIMKNNCIVPLGVSTSNSFVNAGFKLKSVTINRKQARCDDLFEADPYCIVPREYLMIFNKK